MKLSANLSLMYAHLPLEQAMEQAKAHGFDAVEILFPYQQTPCQLARLLEANTLELVLINTPVGPNGEKGLAALPGRQTDFRNGLEQALQVCQATGCRSVHVMAGFPPLATEPAARTALLQNLTWAAERAATAGCVLTLEALNRADMPGYFYWLPEQVLEILKSLGSSHVRMQFDFYHTQKEGLGIVQQLQTSSAHLHHVQFAGVNGRHEPDLTDAEVRQGLLALKALNYGGWIGCEYRPATDVASGLGWRLHYQELLEA